MSPRENFDHYVAQHYLKLFANEEGVVFVGDLSAKTVQGYTDVSRVMGMKNWSLAQELEDGFSKLEGKVASSLKTIRQYPDRVGGLAAPTAKGIRHFIVLHAARGVGVDQAMRQANIQMEAELKKRAPSRAAASTVKIPPGNRIDSLGLGIALGDATNTFMQIRGCIALRSPDSSQFIVGDNPVVTLSSDKSWHRGDIRSPKTYIWFPLNPRLGLLFGDKLGHPLGESKIKIQQITPRLSQTLNKAQVFVASSHIAGSIKGLVRGKIHSPNLGDKRSEVRSADWHPFIILQNEAVYPIDEQVIDALRPIGK